MSRAKTANKNNPTTRVKARDIIYMGQKVKPVLFASMKGSYMAAQYENGQLVLGSNSCALSWSDVISRAE